MMFKEEHSKDKKLKQAVRGLDAHDLLSHLVVMGPTIFYLVSVKEPVAVSLSA